ncbi:MAG: class I SAM-dependent methyltransferase [Dehalococcoidia bacterium]|nr:class I SAM-dependent methyltransferase [Dehalococcoidia bacterium]
MADPYRIDAEYYDLLHDGFDEDIGLWQAFAGRTDRPVLEVGCGSGRIAVPLAAAGATVTGIDPSPAMLARAREAASAPGVRVDLREGTLGDAELEAGAYGLVLLANDVFLFAEDGDEQVAWLQAAARALHFSGTLVIDVPGPALGLDAAANGQPLLVYAGEMEDGSWLDAWHVHEDDLAAQTRRLLVTYEVTSPDGVVTRQRSEHLLRYVHRFELEYLLRMSGLALLDAYGDYDLGPYTNDSSRLIVTARRTEG